MSIILNQAGEIVYSRLDQFEILEIQRSRNFDRWYAATFPEDDDAPYKFGSGVREYCDNFWDRWDAGDRADYARCLEQTVEQFAYDQECEEKREAEEKAFTATMPF